MGNPRTDLPSSLGHSPGGAGWHRVATKGLFGDLDWGVQPGQATERVSVFAPPTLPGCILARAENNRYSTSSAKV